MNRFLVLDEFHVTMSKHPTLKEATAECCRMSTEEDGDEYFVAEIIGHAGRPATPVKYTSFRAKK